MGSKRFIAQVWVDEILHHEDSLITSRKPEDLDAFYTKLVEVLAVT